jgi:hypothetical protein
MKPSPVPLALIVPVVVLVGTGWVDLITADPERVTLMGHVVAAVAFLFAALWAMRYARRLRRHRLAQRAITLTILLPPAVFALFFR